MSRNQLILLESEYFRGNFYQLANIYNLPTLLKGILHGLDFSYRPLAREPNRSALKVNDHATI